MNFFVSDFQIHTDKQVLENKDASPCLGCCVVVVVVVGVVGGVYSEKVFQSS